MAISALTKVQKATVLALVEAHRLDAVPVDTSRAASFMRQAEERLGQLPLLTSVAVKYGIAYDAAHDVGEALLAAYGFRTANGPGQHEALGRYGLGPGPCARSSTSRRPTRRRVHLIGCAGRATRTATKPSRSVLPQPRRPSRWPVSSSMLPWPGV